LCFPALLALTALLASFVSLAWSLWEISISLTHLRNQIKYKHRVGPGSASETHMACDV